MNIRTGLIVASFLLLCRPWLSAQVPAPEVTVQTVLSKTAVWLGDPLRYEVSVVHDDSVEVIRDNLEPENLNLEPFTILEMESEERPLGEKTVHKFTFLLALHEPVEQEATIPSFNIFYATRQPGRLGSGQEVETHTLVIPPQNVGFRSTLTSDSRDIRDGIRVRQAETPARLVWYPGWLILGYLVVLGSRRLVTHWRTRDSGRVEIDFSEVKKSTLERVNALSKAAAEDFPQICRALSEALKEALGKLYGLPAASLTTEELERELSERQIPESLVSEIVQLLAECDRVRYSAPQEAPEESHVKQFVGRFRRAVTRLVVP